MDEERDKFVSGSRVFMIAGVVQVLFGLFLLALAAVLLVYHPYSHSPALHVVSLLEAAAITLSGALCLMCSRGRHATESCWWYLILHTAVGFATLTLLILDFCLLFPRSLLVLILQQDEAAGPLSTAATLTALSVAGPDVHTTAEVVAVLYITIVTVHGLSFLVILITVLLSLINLICLRRGIYHPSTD